MARLADALPGPTGPDGREMRMTEARSSCSGEGTTLAEVRPRGLAQLAVPRPGTVSGLCGASARSCFIALHFEQTAMRFCETQIQPHAGKQNCQNYNMTRIYEKESRGRVSRMQQSVTSHHAERMGLNKKVDTIDTTNYAYTSLDTVHHAGLFVAVQEDLSEDIFFVGNQQSCCLKMCRAWNLADAIECDVINWEMTTCVLIRFETTCVLIGFGARRLGKHR